MNIVGAIQYYKNARGLAIILYNEKTKNHGDLFGTRVDAINMKKAFESIGFAIALLPNAPLKQVRDVLVAFASFDNYPESYNCFAIYFAGHGGEGDILLSGDGIEFKIDDVILKRLNKKFNSTLSDRIAQAPVFIFIDTNRGGKDPFGTASPSGYQSFSRSTVLEHLPSNVLIAYGVGKGFAVPDEHTWTSTLVGKLTTDKPIRDILEESILEMPIHYKADALPEYVLGSSTVGLYNIIRNSSKLKK